MKKPYFATALLIFGFGLFIAAVAGPAAADSSEKAQASKLNINKATQRDIAVNINPVLGKDVCHAITGDRMKNGPYKNLEDLTRSEKITEEDIKKLRETVCVNC